VNCTHENNIHPVEVRVCEGCGITVHSYCGRETQHKCHPKPVTYIDVSDYEPRERGRYNRRYDLHPASLEYDEGAL
jgi:hypothetical protein